MLFFATKTGTHKQKTTYITFEFGWKFHCAWFLLLQRDHTSDICATVCAEKPIDAVSSVRKAIHWHSVCVIIRRKYAFWQHFRLCVRSRYRSHWCLRSRSHTDSVCNHISRSVACQPAYATDGTSLLAHDTCTFLGASIWMNVFLPFKQKQYFLLIILNQ